MSLTLRSLYRSYYGIYNITKSTKWTCGKNYPVRILCSGICHQNNYLHRPLVKVKSSLNVLTFSKCSTQNTNNPPSEPEQKKPGIFKRFQQMYRDYWYVLVPVHCVTSAIWFGSLYYTVKSGVDILSMLQSIGVSETLLAPIRDSSAGYFALAFALYKLITPLRYAVTIGGTTYAIKKLTTMGVIKPVPSRERIKEMFQEKKGTIQDRFIESKQHYQSQMKDKRNQVVEEMRRYKTEMRNMKNKVKKM